MAGISFAALQVVFLPIELKGDTESQPVNAWNMCRLSDFSRPNVSNIDEQQNILKFLSLYDFPKPVQRLNGPAIFESFS